jgi:hypothetical protein
MKKAFLLIVACTFAFVSAYAQTSAVEAVSQLTKAEQFKAKNSFVKETTIYEDKQSGMKLYAKLFTDLNSGEQLTALEIWPTVGSKLLTGGNISPLGYLDMDQIDDLLLALETILSEAKAADQKQMSTITYTANGGIDVFFTNAISGSAFGGTPGVVVFRKKWYHLNEYGVQTISYSEATTDCSIKNLPKLIAAVKEAQTIAKQSLGK